MYRVCNLHSRCPEGAIKINWASTTSKKFREKMIEYAYAAQLDKQNIYINMAYTITKQCDCMGPVSYTHLTLPTN